MNAASPSAAAAAAIGDLDYGNGTADCDAAWRNGTAESCQLSTAPQPFMIVIQGGADSNRFSLPKIVRKTSVRMTPFLH